MFWCVVAWTVLLQTLPTALMLCGYCQSSSETDIKIQIREILCRCRWVCPDWLISLQADHLGSILLGTPQMSVSIDSFLGITFAQKVILLHSRIRLTSKHHKAKLRRALKLLSCSDFHKAPVFNTTAISVTWFLSTEKILRLWVIFP